MIDIRARNFENAAPCDAAVTSVTYTVKVNYAREVTMAKTRRAEKPKMGRPRKVDDVVRISKGARINPELFDAVMAAVNNGYIPGVTNFSEAVEKALTRLIGFKPKKASA